MYEKVTKFNIHFSDQVPDTELICDQHLIGPVIDAFCGQDNGRVATIITGGTESYSYNWTYLDSLKSVSVNSNILDGIYSGQYKLYLSDAHGGNFLRLH